MEGRDPDIGPGAIAFTRDIAEARSSGFANWFLRRQGWLFFPLLTLEGLNLHYAGLRHVIADKASPFRRVEIVVVAIRLSAYVAALALLLPPGKAVAFFFVQMAVFGLCLGGSFAPSHKGMPIVPRDMKIDFLRRQVMMSRNVRGGLVVDIAMGGLNYQIEHHLFPSMPRPNLRLAQPPCGPTASTMTWPTRRSASSSPTGSSSATSTTSACGHVAPSSARSRPTSADPALVEEGAH